MPVTIMVRKRSNMLRTVKKAGFISEKAHITKTSMAKTMNSLERTNLESFFWMLTFSAPLRPYPRGSSG